MELDNKEVTERLENIFMPYMAKSKKKLLNDGNQYIHYTSAENALSILKSETLWMRSPACMNDYMEISHGHQLLLDFFHNQVHREKFITAIDAYEEGISDQILDGFDAWWRKIRRDTFIASISVHSLSEKKHGRLSMWRAYGSQGGRAGLVLNFPPNSNKKLGVILSPAAYFTVEELEKELLEVIESILKNIDYLKTLQRETIIGTVIVSLILLAVCLKHPGFKEEQEWRLIYLPNMVPSNNWIERSVEIISGIPQIVYKLPLKNNEALELTGLNIPELIETILIGPTQYPLAMFDAFSSALSNAGVLNAEERITISEIPLRT
ncbi:MAG: DUF2971 domain-containing protein [Burkholderiaceae bacterium]